MANVREKPSGFCIQLGQERPKREQGDLLRLYSQVVATLTPEKKATISGGEIHNLIFTLKDLPNKEVKDKAIGELVATSTTQVDPWKIAKWNPQCANKPLLG